MPRTWVVVADQSQARFFTLENRTGPLVEVDRLEHPEARRKEGELISDRPGRAFDSAGTGRHAMEPALDAKEQEATRFAKEVAERIEQARLQDHLGKIILVAAPYFLGLLRQKLSPSAAALVAREIDKNLGQYDATEVRAHLPELL